MAATGDVVARQNSHERSLIEGDSRGLRGDDAGQKNEQSEPLKRSKFSAESVGHNSKLERATGLRCWP